MQIDIEKLNRKTPYPEPTEDFFKQMQANVISRTVGKNPVAVKKEAKVFALNFKWMSAAAVVLIAGITAFLGLNNDPEVYMAKQSIIVDSFYQVEQAKPEPTTDLLADHIATPETPSKISKPQTSAPTLAQNSKNQVSADINMADRENYASETKKKSAMDVEKVLAAFTPDQLKDIDRNSEQDVYLDLYN